MYSLESGERMEIHASTGGSIALYAFDGRRVGVLTFQQVSDQGCIFLRAASPWSHGSPGSSTSTLLYAFEGRPIGVVTFE